MAEREGFEPSVRSRAQRFSRPPRSTTPASLRGRRRSRPAANARETTRRLTRPQALHPTALLNFGPIGMTLWGMSEDRPQKTIPLVDLGAATPGALVRLASGNGRGADRGRTADAARPPAADDGRPVAPLGGARRQPALWRNRRSVGATPDRHLVHEPVLRMGLHDRRGARSRRRRHAHAAHPRLAVPRHRSARRRHPPHDRRRNLYKHHLARLRRRHHRHGAGPLRPGDQPGPAGAGAAICRWPPIGSPTACASMPARICRRRTWRGA